ncbi:hypothetical protein K491DRAFT_101427 [Lophiostoma macrostomum CBS 122681]|uniref:Uncharacterized protein n=1 Tax=Lophiostoma macrostomum CBS 122681 TaxID=1314788 RepID=A0A6A6SYF7_9PLEO|nr:hypothetical protein K491DRAFT_101427 [Lophiostoma macrostomum CBS 122681]
MGERICIYKYKWLYKVSKLYLLVQWYNVTIWSFVGSRYSSMTRPRGLIDKREAPAFGCLQTLLHASQRPPRSEGATQQQGVTIMVFVFSHVHHKAGSEGLGILKDSSIAIGISLYETYTDYYLNPDAGLR